jgi:hypothetical protein
MLRKLLHLAYLVFCLGLILACVKVSIADDDVPAPVSAAPAAAACTAKPVPAPKPAQMPAQMPDERAEPCAPLR